ncbi:hypothetical protein [Anabaena sp. CCY 9402-a]
MPSVPFKVSLLGVPLTRLRTLSVKVSLTLAAALSVAVMVIL